MEENKSKEDLMSQTEAQSLSREELELISICLLEQMSVADRIPTLMDDKLMEAKEDLRRRLRNLNCKICDMIHE